MKIVLVIIGLLVLLGVGYGLAFIGVIPVKAMSAKSPELKKILIAMKLDSPSKSATTATTAHATATPLPDPLAGDRAELAAERAQLQHDRAMMQQHAAAAQATANRPAADIATSPKVVAIYDTMKPTELAALFAKLSDAQVTDAMLRMDEQKAGKVLVAMPPDRAARITTRMNAATGPQAAPPSQTSMVTTVQ